MLFDIIQISLAILLVIVILLQSQGAGLGAAFGGGEGNIQRTKRGGEKLLFNTTVILAILFLGFSLFNAIR